MKSVKLSFAIVTVLTIIGCDTSDTNYYDYLSASGTVKQADAVTPVSGLPISEYDWVVNFKDGSTVGFPFKVGYTVSTDNMGKFSFSTSQLALQSGNLEISYCTDVCVSWGTDYEDVCVDWVYEDVCLDWEYDEYGNEYCTYWDTQEYCVDWETRAYDYCYEWAEDCDYYYPIRHGDDIASAYSEITYPQGSNFFTTMSEEMTYPGSALRSSSTTTGNDSVVSYVWNQNDSYITPVYSKASSLAKIYSELACSKKLKKSGTPKFGRNHGRAVRTPLSKLTASKLSLVQKARNTCSAYPKTK